jgi:hypothetical protein
MRLLLDDTGMDMDMDMDLDVDKAKAKAKSSRPKRAGRVGGVVLER